MESLCRPPLPLPPLKDIVYDVAIIGAGITGCAAAFELSRTTARVALLDRDSDVAAGATRANSGIVHAGYDPLPGTRMARCNVEGNALLHQYAGELNLPFRPTGSLVLALSQEELSTLRTLYARGLQNGVPGLRLLSAEEARAREPALTPEVRGALYAPTAGVIGPWETALAFAETAVVNGADFLPCCEVTGIRRAEGPGGEKALFVLTTGRGTVCARRVVNAAGARADQVNDLLAPPRLHIRPNRGQYYLLDRTQGGTVGMVIFQCPTAAGKGVLVAPTAHGNLIVGPDAQDIADPDDTATTAAGLAFVAAQARRSVPALSLRDSIRNFAGVRAVCGEEDFILEESAACPGLITLGGIKSPGLTSAPAIARECVELLKRSGLALPPRAGFRLCPRPVRFRDLSPEGRAAAVRRNPLYGRVVCRCEDVTEGEIADAVRSPIPARSVDGVKRRAGTGMGRCQGGFCSPRVAAVLAREWGVPLTAVEQDRPGSFLLTGRTREPAEEEGGR